MKYMLAATLLSLLPATLCAETTLGPAGLLSRANKQMLPTVIISSGHPLAKDPWVLHSGTYYTVEFASDGSQDTSLVGPEFFSAIWIDKLEVEGLEIRPIGLDRLGFNDEGVLEMGFIALKPGSFSLTVPQAKGDTQRIQVTIQ